MGRRVWIWVRPVARAQEPAAATPIAGKGPDRFTGSAVQSAHWGRARWCLREGVGTLCPLIPHLVADSCGPGQGRPGPG